MIAFLWKHSSGLCVGYNSNTFLVLAGAINNFKSKSTKNLEQETKKIQDIKTKVGTKIKDVRKNALKNVLEELIKKRKKFRKNYKKLRMSSYRLEILKFEA